MQIACVESIDSTYLFLCERIRSGKINESFVLYTLNRTKGVGSRENSWQNSSENLHLSFCVREGDLPSDLPSTSVGIYFTYLLEEILQEKSFRIWPKWPDDLYLDDKKVGEVVSTRISDFIIGGMGLNLRSTPHDTALCDVEVLLKDLIQEFLQGLEKKFLWKHVFSGHMLEFEESRQSSVRYGGKIFSLENAFLYKDGSILLGDKRVYSLR